MLTTAGSRIPALERNLLGALHLRACLRVRPLRGRRQGARIRKQQRWVREPFGDPSDVEIGRPGAKDPLGTVSSYAAKYQLLKLRDGRMAAGVSPWLWSNTNQLGNVASIWAGGVWWKGDGRCRGQGMGIPKYMGERMDTQPSPGDRAPSGTPETWGRGLPRSRSDALPW